MTDHIASFFSAWSMDDATARAATIAAAMTPDATYADPRTPSVLDGPAAVSDYIGMFAEAAPGATVVVVKSGETQGSILATIAFRMAGGMEQMGQYFVEVADDGRINRMVGFVGTGAPE